MPTHVSAEIIRMPTAQIEVDPDNIRTHYDPELLEGFRDMLRTNGEFINPPHVYQVGPNRYRVKHGNTRILAAQGLVEDIAVKIVDPPSSAEERIVGQLSENLAQGGLSPLDTARALQRLRTAGLSIRGIQEHLAIQGVKRSVAWIHACLKMLSLPSEVQGQIERGEVNAWEAVGPLTTKVVRVPVEARQAEFNEQLRDLAVQLLNEPGRHRAGAKRDEQRRSASAMQRWEILPMPGDSPEDVAQANSEGRQDVVMALNALRLVIDRGVPPKDSASGRLLRTRARQLDRRAPRKG
jgi:ParB/RepB/Spo0J family partition protein